MYVHENLKLVIGQFLVFLATYTYIRHYQYVVHTVQCLRQYRSTVKGNEIQRRHESDDSRKPATHHAFRQVYLVYVPARLCVSPYATLSHPLNAY